MGQLSIPVPWLVSGVLAASVSLQSGAHQGPARAPAGGRLLSAAGALRHPAARPMDRLGSLCFQRVAEVHVHWPPWICVEDRKSYGFGIIEELRELYIYSYGTRND